MPKKTHSKLLEITKMKNLHLGQRVFIVATGPSLTFEDLEMIKNEFSISMNSIVKVLNDTNYRPSYYLIQDKEVCDSLTSLINSSNLECVFLGMGNSYCLKGNLGRKQKKKILKKIVPYNLELSYHYYEMCYKQDKSKFHFSNDFSKKSYDGYTVTFSALQLAYYLGFSEIYLLGCDCTYGGHFGEDNTGKDNNKTPPYFGGYEEAKHFLYSKGVKVINCTRGGMLEIFERKKLEDVINGRK